MNSTELDAHLVRRYLNGEENALHKLIVNHQTRVKGFIFSKVKDRDVTEDIFQDTYIKVIKSLRKGTYNEEGKFLPWVMRIAHNLIVDYFRKQNKIPTLSNSSDFDIFSVISDESLHMEERLVKSQIELEVQELVTRLPKDQKEVVEMRMYKDMSFKEISENTGVSINTALGRMRYALQNIRKEIEAKNLVLSY
jgi:RNA polymerase sigma-70 factor (ECF subfamily)